MVSRRGPKSFVGKQAVHSGNNSVRCEGRTSHHFSGEGALLANELAQEGFLGAGFRNGLGLAGSIHHHGGNGAVGIKGGGHLHIGQQALAEAVDFAPSASIVTLWLS